MPQHHGSSGHEHNVTIPSALKYFIGLSTLFIAGCSAFFSVCGLGALFVGSSTAVMIMASSLEVGKLVAASFLYWFWRQLTIPMRFYMTSAVVVLIGITSLGTYGYLARAYERTHTGIGTVENQIAALQKEIDDTQRRIDATRSRFGKVDESGHENTVAIRQRMDQATAQLNETLGRLQDQRKAVQDRRDKDIQTVTARMAHDDDDLKKAIASEDTAITAYQQQLADLDHAVETYTKIGGPGILEIGGTGLFQVDGVKRGQALREQQRAEREAISMGIAACRGRQEQARLAHAKRAETANLEIASIRDQAGKDTEKIDADERVQRKTCADVVAQAQAQLASLQNATATLRNDGDVQVEALYKTIRARTEDIRQLQEKIATTDIGSYRFVARAFDTGADSVVKWLMLALVIVFDPLAVCLAVSFNVALLRERREKMFGGAQRIGLLHAVPMKEKESEESSSTEPCPADQPPRRKKRWMTWMVNIILTVLLASAAILAIHWVMQTHQKRAHSAHAKWIPPNSFAIVTIRPDEISRHDASRAFPSWIGKTNSPVLISLLASCLSGGGFNSQADVYLFAKFPEAQTADKPNSNPVILCGLVAQVDQPVLAEATLSGVAEQITRNLRHGHDNASSLIRNRAMIQYGHGRYMDPEGGFFTFALTGHSAILLVEFEGDPQSPSVEREIRHYLEAPAPEAPPSTHADGVCSIWFDANRFFHDLPKNTAAELRGQKLQRNIGFDMTLNVRPADSDKLMIAAHYNYQADRFNQSKQPSAVELLASLGPDNQAGIAGRLMDRCADTLDYDSLIERLRAVLGDSAKEGIQAVVVEKSCDTSREARFVLTASCDAKTTPPLLAAFQTLWQ